MKRPLTESISAADTGKKIKPDAAPDANQHQHQQTISTQAEAVLYDDNLLYEILHHVDDGRTLASAACVNRRWRKTAHDERLWEVLCTRHDHRSPLQMRTVVSALGGFRKLYSSHLWQILKPAPPAAPAAASVWPCLPPAPPVAAQSSSKTRWGKDEVNVSLSLLSINLFKSMSYPKMEK